MAAAKKTKTAAKSKKAATKSKSGQSKSGQSKTKSAAKSKTTASKRTAAKKTAANKGATGKNAAAKKKTTKSTKRNANSKVKNSAVKKTAKASDNVESLPNVAIAVDSPFKNFKPYEPGKAEDYMSPEQEKHFRTILMQWREDLLNEVSRTVLHMRDEAANFPDPADRATQEEEFTVELRTRDRERKLIKKIDQTLDRLEQHDYGYCDTCGVEIGLRRLEARPTATQCVDCKSLDEIRERQLHG